MKNSSDKIWPITGLLPRGQIPRDLRPATVGSKGNEEIGFSEFPNYRHGVHVTLLHVPRSSWKRRRQYDPRAQLRLSCLVLWELDAKRKLFVRLRTQVRLVHAEVSQPLCLRTTVSINQILLKEQASTMM